MSAYRYYDVDKPLDIQSMDRRELADFLGDALDRQAALYQQLARVERDIKLLGGAIMPLLPSGPGIQFLQVPGGRVVQIARKSGGDTEFSFRPVLGVNDLREPEPEPEAPADSPTADDLAHAFALPQ